MEKIIFGDYGVRDNGDVVSYKHGKVRLLKPSINKGGYKIVNLMVDGNRRGFAVHTLIAQAFVPNPENKPQVNHKDGVKTNNAYNNLEWSTASENVRHSFDILQKQPGNQRSIKIEGIAMEFKSIACCAKFLIQKLAISSTYRGVQSHICNVLKGRRGSYKGLFFYYV